MNPDCCSQGTLETWRLFRRSVSPAASAESLSVHGLFLARKRGDLLEGIELCREAVRRSPDEPAHYYHLGKVYLLAGKKHLALHAFRKGLKYGEHRGLNREMKRLGFRRSPLFPFLGRKHPLNRWVGVLFTHLGVW